MIKPQGVVHKINMNEKAQGVVQGLILYINNIYNFILNVFTSQNEKRKRVQI